MIVFDKVDGDTYKAERLDQVFKFNNVAYIEQFNSVIESAIKDISCDGLIKYKNGDSKETTDSLFLKNQFFNNYDI